MPTNTNPTFISANGKVLTPIGPGDDFGNSIALQADGKIIIGGTSYNGNDYDFALVRYNADGSLDTTFSGDGKLMTSIGATADFCQSVIVQADGRIVAVGFSWNGADYDFALTRYNANGTLDTTFSGDGKLITNMGVSSDEAFSVALQPDGQILVAGYVWTGSVFDFGLIRYDASGNTATAVTKPMGGSSDFGCDMALQSDGKIVVVGNAFDGGLNGYGFAVARYNSNADLDLDTTFDGDGKVLTQIGNGADYATGVALQSDGKIVVVGGTFVGNSSYELTLVRYNTNGSLDTTFDGDGKAVISSINSDLPRYSVALQADGKIVVAGPGYNGGNQEFALARFNANGSLDTTFDADGKAFTPVGASGDFATAMALQPDGRILTAGYAWTGSGYDFAMTRHNTDGSLNTAFGPVTTLDGTATYTENGAPVVLDANVNVSDAELDALNGGAGNYAGGSLSISRNGGASSQDIFGFQVSGASFTVSGATLRSGGSTFATFTNTGGTLTINFTSSGTPATSALADDVLGHITYANSSDTPPANVQLAYTFSDGNTGAQGTGPTPGIATGSVQVAITALPETYLWTQLTNGQSIAFNPNEDILRIDDTSITAAAMSVTGSGSASFSYGGKTVTLQTAFGTLAEANVFFVGGSVLIVGDGTPSTANDNGPNTLHGENGNDRLLGLGGDDYLYGGAGADVFNGGAGLDFTRYDDAVSPVTVDLAGTVSNTGDAAGDRFVSVEGIVGSSFGDVLYGDDNANNLQGRDGADTVSGRAGDDSLQGGNANDTLNGDAGHDSLFGQDGIDTLRGGTEDDYLTGGAGGDALDGGSGIDFARYDSATAAVTVDLAGTVSNAGEAIGDSFISIESVVGSAFGDSLFGDGGANELQGRGGTDSIDGRGGNDTLNGGALGDTLTGGAGNDSFVFARGEANGDTVVDFNGLGAAAGDRLVFSGYGAGATFTQATATTWHVNYSGGMETLTFSNAPSIDASDFKFL